MPPSSSREEAERLGMDTRCVVEESLRRAIMEERKKRIAEALKELAAAGEDSRRREGYGLMILDVSAAL